MLNPTVTQEIFALVFLVETEYVTDDPLCVESVSV